MNLRALLREPLLHFLIAGAAIFALFSGSTAPDERRIVIDAGRVERLAGQFAQNFRRMPDAAELDSLIREDVKDEVYYREGLRLGLDRDDEVVRRRMRNKLEGFASSADDIPSPDDMVLEKWLKTHPQRFAGEAKVAFDQRFAGASESIAKGGLAALRTGQAWFGEPSPLPSSVSATEASEIDSQFGEGFAQSLSSAPVGEWSGPVRSALGWHLVRVRESIPPVPPRLADIRQRVENDWRAAQARARSEAAYREMLARYTVAIDRP